MRRGRTILMLVATAGLLFGLPLAARAGGGAGGNTCVTTSPGSGTVQIKATVAVEVLDVSAAQLGNPVPIDFTMRLERGGVLYFDRVSVTDQVLSTNEDIACLFLPHEDNQANPEIFALGQRIRTAFGLSPTRVFCITAKSVSSAEPAGNQVIPNTNRGASLSDLTIFAVEGACN